MHLEGQLAVGPRGLHKGSLGRTVEEHGQDDHHRDAREGGGGGVRGLLVDQVNMIENHHDGGHHQSQHHHPDLLFLPAGLAPERGEQADRHGDVHQVGVDDVERPEAGSQAGLDHLAALDREQGGEDQVMVGVGPGEQGGEGRQDEYPGHGPVVQQVRASGVAQGQHGHGPGGGGDAGHLQVDPEQLEGHARGVQGQAVAQGPQEKGEHQHQQAFDGPGFAVAPELDGGGEAQGPAEQRDDPGVVYPGLHRGGSGWARLAQALVPYGITNG